MVREKAEWRECVICNKRKRTTVRKVEEKIFICEECLRSTKTRQLLLNKDKYKEILVEQENDYNKAMPLAFFILGVVVTLVGVFIKSLIWG